jgi:hypothetical protein
MAEFIVELYVSGSDCDAAGRHELRAREAVAALRAEGTHVRFLRSIYLPEEETCFFLYRASSIDTVHVAARRAELAYEHVAVTARTRPRSHRLGGSR